MVRHVGTVPHEVRLGRSTYLVTHIEALNYDTYRLSVAYLDQFDSGLQDTDLGSKLLAKIMDNS